MFIEVAGSSTGEYEHTLMKKSWFLFFSSHQLPTRSLCAKGMVLGVPPFFMLEFLTGLILAYAGDHNCYEFMCTVVRWYPKDSISQQLLSYPVAHLFSPSPSSVMLLMSWRCWVVPYMTENS